MPEVFISFKVYQKQQKVRKEEKGKVSCKWTESVVSWQNEETKCLIYLKQYQLLVDGKKKQYFLSIWWSLLLRLIQIYLSLQFCV